MLGGWVGLGFSVGDGSSTAVDVIVMAGVAVGETVSTGVGLGTGCGDGEGVSVLTTTVVGFAVGVVNGGSGVGLTTATTVDRTVGVGLTTTVTLLVDGTTVPVGSVPCGVAIGFSALTVASNTGLASVESTVGLGAGWGDSSITPFDTQLVATSTQVLNGNRSIVRITVFMPPTQIGPYNSILTGRV